MEKKPLNFYLINTRIRPLNHSSKDVTDEFEKAILADNTVKAVKPCSQYWFLPLYYLDKITKKIRIHFIKILSRYFVFSSSDKKDAYFVVLMGEDFIKFYPYAFLRRKKRYIYVFDAWVSAQPELVDFIQRYRINHVFVSASQAVTGLNEKLKYPLVSWIPEGINVSIYKQIPYTQRDIDVIQIGRKYDWYHEQILSFLDHTNRVYLYEKTKGVIIFPTREEFINGLARSKISICVPSNITHPERSGVIETMTNRYLQSIASKCLIVGYAPKEMIELFGYNPVVEIDKENPVEQLQAILDHYLDYIPLIEKNYETVSKHHTWEKRWEQIKNSNLFE